MPRATRDGGSAALALVALVMVACVAGVGAWLWVMGPETLPLGPSSVTVALPPPLAPLSAAALPSAPPLAPALPQTAAPQSAVAVPPPAPTVAPSAPSTPSRATPAAPLPVPKPKPPRVAALAPAPPNPDLIERGRQGPLPRIAPDGRRPWQVYARPFDRDDGRPRIAIVIDELGLSGAATQAAIQDLPGEITLAFSPFSPDLANDIALARVAGHEVLLGLPMAPVAAGGEAGPRALETSLTRAQNLSRLDWMMSRVQGYVGVTDFAGGRFTASAREMRPILLEIRKRGLMFFDSRASASEVGVRLARALGVPVAASDRVIDRKAARDAIDAELAALEQEARRTGRAIGLGFPYPVTIERVALWARKLRGKGIVLAPVSAMVPLERAADAREAHRG